MSDGHARGTRPVEVTDVAVRAIQAVERAWAARILGEHFGSSRVVTRGVVHDAADLPALVAMLGAETIGVLSYRIEAEQCEIVALVASRAGLGAGTMLLEAARVLAREAGCDRMWLVTTNDNLAAQAFYESRGFRRCAVHSGAVTRARALKPEIPLRSEDGTAIEDEIEFELRLTGPQPTSQADEARSSI